MAAPLLLTVLAGVGGTVDYSDDVRPILARNCFVCHGPDEESREQELRLDTFEGAARDLGGYQAIDPGSSSTSEAFLRITDDFDPMPPEDSGHRLEPEEIELLRRWIDEGAHYAQHWAFVPPAPIDPPTLEDDPWSRNGIDRFVLDRLRQEGLAPSPEADRATLARRASIDLVGLPPTLERVRAFVDDPRDDAYERYVDELLASPAYGERWASVWLDLARYADSSGHGSDPLRVIWRYRDWVIDALNANMPFDRFTIEQLAGDLLMDPTLDQRLATAFHRNTMTNTEGGTDDEEFRVAAVKDRAITTSEVWLGLTMGCAQCHSHKYDPLSQEEFYSFYAFFDQTADTDKNDDRPRLAAPTADQRDEVDALEARIAAFEAELADPNRDVSEGLARWEAQRAEAASDWRVLAPDVLQSSGGADFEVRPDGSILATGESPESDVYTFEADLPVDGVTAVRLEVMPDDSLSAGGPGRLPGIGNIVLNDVQLEALSVPVPKARFVRITNHGHDRILSLAEVQVFRGDVNVALEGTATQSSTAYEGDAERAIDGNTDGDYHAGASVTHTATESDPWFELDLGRSVPIDCIHLWNRTDGNLEHRLSGFVVDALDEERRTIWSTGVRDAPRPRLVLDAGGRADELLVARATADVDDPDWSIALAIDDDRGGMSGWGLNPSLGGTHVAVFELANELLAPRVRITLRQEYGAHHTIGRLRLSVTARPNPEPALPTEVRLALDVAPETRSDDEQAAIVRHFQTVDPELAVLRERIDAVQAEIDALGIPTIPVMVELEGDERRTTRVMLRGNFLSPGDEVAPDVPEVLHPWPEGEPRNRLGLARWLVDPANPLTGRVTVNRLWSRLFGVGLVETEEDFGTQGQTPSHPELLDWLALELVDGGWDLKALLRTIVTSATYRQSSTVTEELAGRDRPNRLLARGPRHRLDAEQVRDVLLATSGLLSDTMHGPSVFPPQPEGLWQAAFNSERTWTESEGPDRYRRALYVFHRRTVPYPPLATFDASSRERCTLRRPRTNTPLQAFVTLNDPGYVEAAQALARRIVDEGGTDVASRARHGLELCLLRDAAQEQIGVTVELYEGELEHYSVEREAARELVGETEHALDDEALPELAAWTVVANVLLNQDAVLVKE